MYACFDICQKSWHVETEPAVIKFKATKRETDLWG